MAADEESKLLARCRDGQADAWDALFQAYYTTAAKFVYQAGHSLTPEDVEEVCQDVFLAIIRNLNSFSGQSRFQTWLYRIAANKTRDYELRQAALKRGGGHVPVSLQSENPETGLTLDLPGSTPAPDSAMISRERAHLLGKALVQLGDPCREIVELRYFGDLSYDELARTLDLNVKTVSSRLSKCLDKLEAIATEIFSEGEKSGFPSNA